jgi:hypothetical protein
MVSIGLAAPVVDRLAADPKVTSDLGDTPAGLYELQDTMTELGWIPLWHVAPSQGSSA